MSRTVVLDLPDETIVRYQQGAAAARKPLEEFLVDRLNEVAPPYGGVETLPLDEKLNELNQLSDNQLWVIARQRLNEDEQMQYNDLLEKNRFGPLPPHEQELMERLGNHARRLTLHKAHALMLLKWRGHELPTLAELQEDK